MSFWTALEFLTIIPSPLRREIGVAELGKSLAFFPVVGLLLDRPYWCGNLPRSSGNLHLATGKG